MSSKRERAPKKLGDDLLALLEDLLEAPAAEEAEEPTEQAPPPAKRGNKLRAPKRRTTLM